jgi:hypothetical protein
VIVPPSIAATVVLKCALLSFKPTIGAKQQAYLARAERALKIVRELGLEDRL